MANNLLFSNEVVDIVDDDHSIHSYDATEASLISSVVCVSLCLDPS